MLNDLRFFIRGLRRGPSQALVAIAILAVGLAVAVSVFAYINGFRQPFPGVDTEGLVRVFGATKNDRYQDISYLDFRDYSARAEAFEGIAASQPFYAASVRRETTTDVAFLEAVSGNFFKVLDVKMSAGRAISSEDDRPGAEPVAVISHAWWLRGFNGDRSVLGSTIHLNSRPFTLVGVASPEFLGTVSGFRPDVWIPIAPFRDRYVSWAKLAEDRDRPLVRVYGRLRPDSPERVGQSRLEALAAALDQAYPRKTEPRQVRIGPATWIDPRVRVAETPTVHLMLVIAGVLLLLVCANVANLILALASRRQHEISMRAALGASPRRLFRQILIENVLLSALAGVVALPAVGPATARIGSYFARPSVWGEYVARRVDIDWRVAIFALLISVVTGVLASLLPALRASRRNLVETLKSGARTSTGPPTRIWGWRVPLLSELLVSAQVALSVALLVVAGLLLRTLVAVGWLDPGFSYDRLLVTHISTSSTSLMPGDRERFFRELSERIAEEPWVRSATVADYPLLSPHPQADFRLEGRTHPVPLVYSRVQPGFFEALGIEVRRGRSFVSGDGPDAPAVAVINERLARLYFPGQEPVGRRFWWPSAKNGADWEFRVVGVVRDTKTRDFLSDMEPTVYFSYPQHPYPTGNALIVATNGTPAAAGASLQRWLRNYEPHLAIVNVVSYREVVSGFLYAHRMNAELFSLLALLGLVLAAVGIFSVASLAVGRRAKEFGIRMSVGAGQRQIALLVVGRALGPVALGLAAGLAASFGVTGLVRSLLHGVEPTDPASWAAGAAVLGLSGLAAACLAARRANSVDPLVSLRSE